MSSVWEGESITKQIHLDIQEGPIKQQNEEKVVNVIIYLHLTKSNRKFYSRSI